MIPKIKIIEPELIRFGDLKSYEAFLSQESRTGIWIKISSSSAVSLHDHTCISAFTNDYLCRMFDITNIEVTLK